MSDIKSTIAILCEVLNYSCDFDIEPVSFKYAKYDKTDDSVISSFWNLLNILCQCTSKGNIVQNVKIYFAGQNYKNLDFYSLPNDMTSGSRELLIALSWLLGKNNILENPIKKKILESKISHEFNSNLPTNFELEIEEVQLKTIEQYQNYILLLCGKINTNLKAISEYNSKTIQLVEKIHNATEKLSVGELNELKNSGNLKSYLQEIKPISNLIEAHSKWKSKEKYFWKWMMTVIELKKGNNTKSLNKDNLISFFNCLRTHVKQVLTEDDRQISKQIQKLPIDETMFPRCVKSNETKLLDAHLFTLGNNLKAAKLEEKRNLELICDTLRILLLH